MKRKFSEIMNHESIMKSTPHVGKLKVMIKSDPVKGRGIYATQPIKKGEVIALYHMKIFNWSKYKSPTDFVYSFEIYDNNSKSIPHLIGDITASSFYPPKEITRENGKLLVPYWGPFVNEPSIDQTYNAEFDCASKDKRRKAPGKEIVYSIVAKKKIKRGEEVTVYYGDQYPRNYKIPLE